MNEKTGTSARRLATIGLPLTLLLALVLALTVMAEDGTPAAGAPPVPYVLERTSAATGVLTGTVAVTKTVEPEQVGPGDSRVVTYEVVFTDTNTGPVTLDRITDTLPADFEFRGMAYGSDVTTPPQQSGNLQLVWQNISFTDTLTVRYYVEAVDRTGVYQNSVVATAGGEQIGPASATLEVGGRLVWIPIAFRGGHLPGPVWTLTKTADPAEVAPDDPVDYTVVIRNDGDRAGTFVSLADTLPDEFEFEEMLPGSGVTDPPTGTTGKIMWDGYWTLIPGEELTVKYRVESGGAGDQVNTFGIYTAGGTELGSASSTVTVGGGLPFEDDFDSGLSPEWEPFTNWPGLSADRWFWSGAAPTWGIYNYEWDAVEPGWTGYDMSIYNSEEAQAWTDYRIEVRLKDSKDTGAEKSGLAGVWFRGTYEDSGANDGRTVGGYYVYMKASNETLYLMRTPPGDPCFATHTIQATRYWAPRIGRAHWYKLIIEVEGNHIEVWFEDDEDGTSNPVRVFNWTDSMNAWPQGTVGFATYYTTARYDYIRVEPLP
jgi:uncharacterized repeat protein (TIGR01451 family)